MTFLGQIDFVFRHSRACCNLVVYNLTQNIKYFLNWLLWRSFFWLLRMYVTLLSCATCALRQSKTACVACVQSVQNQNKGRKGRNWEALKGSFREVRICYGLTLIGLRGLRLNVVVTFATHANSLRGVPDGNDFALLREETARRRRFEVVVLSNFYDWIFSKTWPIRLLRNWFWHLTLRRFFIFV